MGYSWNIPRDLMLTEIDYGVFDVEIDVDAGPFGGKLHVKQKMTVRE